jgi:2-oxoglutarate ferredoxin oxidoreductase subunit beta
VPYFDDTLIDYEPGTTREVTMPDGSRIFLKKLEEDYDPTDRDRALDVIHQGQKEEKLVTGLLYVHPEETPYDEDLGLVDAPLAALPLEVVRPSRQALEQIMEQLQTGRAMGAGGA